MSLASGHKLGPYEIIEPIGAGGMGEVYKARDTRLDRTVAIKISSEQFSERFDREARAVAALNHPHICQLYDVGPDYLVMEYIEGQAVKGPMPSSQAVEVALQIVDALDAAHRKGIVHRDLKPANILYTKSGIKLLDFGLAKQVDKHGGAAGQTVTLALTAAHTVVGTPQYMAPEQIEGKEADARTDIFAFGCVLYELLTGRKAFEGKTASTIMASVLATEPPAISTVQPGAAPPPLERVVKTCLAKDPEERWQSARELKHALEWAVADAAQVASSAPARGTRQWLPWAVAGLLAAALAAAWLLRPKAPEAALVQLELPAPEGNSFSSTNLNRYAVSPDGKRVVFTAVAPDGKRSLWVRPLASTRADRLAGTEGASTPFWAPDSRWLAYFANSKLLKIEVTGGPPQVLCDATSTSGGTWNRDGVILIGDSSGTMRRVPASGGTPSSVLTRDASRNEMGQIDPRFLPDGRQFLYYSLAKQSGIALGSLDGKSRFLMAHTESPSSYAAAGAGRGFLFFVRRSQLMAQPFDAGKGTLGAEAMPVAEDLSNGPSWSASENGVLIFRRAFGSDVQLAWVDRDGKPLGPAGQSGRIFAPRISPDQKTIAFFQSDGTNTDIWLFDTERNNATRFTFEPGYDAYPTWSPDGTQIAYTSSRGSDRLVVARPASGIGKERILFRAVRGSSPVHWSRDGRWLVLQEVRGGNASLNLLPLTVQPSADSKPISFQETAYDDRDGALSPDGHWMLYSSNQTGRREIFVQSLPDAAGGAATRAGKWQISTNGGSQPAWRADGKEIFYVAADGRMTSVPVESGPAAFKPGVPKPMFQTRLEAEAITRAYDVSPDGKRFLLAQPVAEGSAVPITVILNWPALLKK